MSSPVVSSRTPIGQIINQDGSATFAFLKWMQNIGTTVNVSFDTEGAYQGDIGDQATIDGRETLASIVQNISTDGVVQGPGIDFALPYLNKDTDHIADGSGSPLAGGKVAYTALVASGPLAGQTIRFDGTAWLPVTIAYPGVGIAVSTGSAWGTSIDPADVPRLSAANIFTGDQEITDNLRVDGTLSTGTGAIFSGAPPLTPSTAEITFTSGVTYIDSVGPGPTTPGTFNLRSISSDGSINLPAAIIDSSRISLANGDVVIGQKNGASFGSTFNIRVDSTGPASFIESWGNLYINYRTAGTTTNVGGDFTVAGAKSFLVPHPLDETKNLIHSCLEGPENGVFYRGRAKTDAAGAVTLLLPDYFEALTYIEDRSVLLTAIDDGSDGFPLLKSSEVSAGGFLVRSSIPGTEFYWEVKAVRKVGVDRLKVVAEKPVMAVFSKEETIDA